MSRIDLVSKNLLANFFSIVAKEIIEKNYVRKSLANIAKIAKVTRIFLLAENTRDKYRKNHKNNKNNNLTTIKT